jgi:negative regulator of flagellin synthesis FlgM
LSYTNGISAGQQLPELNESTAASSANRAESASLASHQTKAADQATQVDQAVVSSTATGIAQALSGSDVRMDKVSALQQSIAAGTYAVPSADVAGKLMDALLQ